MRPLQQTQIEHLDGLWVFLVAEQMQLPSQQETRAGIGFQLFTAKNYPYF